MPSWLVGLGHPDNLRQIVNLGGPGTVEVDGRRYSLALQDCLYIGRGARRSVLLWALATAVILALGIGEGAEIRAPMAITVLGGLATSTVLNLLVLVGVAERVGVRGTSGLRMRP